MRGVVSVLRILHLADLHLGYRPSQPDVPSEVFEERDKVLEQAVDVAIQRQVHLVLMAGDLFDDYKPPEPLVENVLRSLNRLQHGGTLLITVPGNHDEYTYHDSVYRKYRDRWPGLLVTNPMPEIVHSFTIGDTQLHIVSMAYTAGYTDVSQPLRKFPEAPGDGVTIAVLHGTIDSLFNNERSLPLDKDALARSGYRYIALGHIHISKRYDLGDAVAYYPGMVAGKGFSDPGVGSFSLITLVDGTTRIDKIDASVPKWHREEVETSAYDSYEALLHHCVQCAQSHSQSLMQIVLKGFAPFPISTERLKTDVGNCCRYVEVVDETIGFSEQLLNQLADGRTIRALFVRKMQEKIRESGNDEEKRKRYQRALLLGLEALGVGGGD